MNYDSRFYCKKCGIILIDEDKIDRFFNRNLKSTMDDFFVLKSKTFQNIGERYRVVCFDCAEKIFGHTIRRKSTGVITIDYKYLFDLTDDEYKMATEDLYGHTLEKNIRKFGEEEGTRKWNEYKRKQALSNTLEYKKEKHNWSEEDFKEYNNSRAVTEENLIKRHGEQLGKDKWKKYKNKQKDSGCSLKYFQEKHGVVLGEQIYKELNQRKRLTLENLIKKHGEEKGLEIYKRLKLKSSIAMMKAKNFNFSKSADKLFLKIIELMNLDKNECYFHGSILGEFYLFIDEFKNYKFYDFYIPSLNKIIEYNGHVWHPKHDDPDWTNPWGETFEDKRYYDETKVAGARKLGYDVLVVWDDDKNNEDKIMNFLNNTGEFEIK